jgi:hypothetical protein
VLPELGFHFAKAAGHPLGGDEGIDKEALLGSGGAEARVVFVGEGFQSVRILARNDVGLGIDAGFEGVEARGGLALDGAGAGRFLRIAAVSLDLT